MAIYLNRCLALWAVVLLLLGLSWPLAAHNGKTAYAIPLEGITIDGKLDDWPEEMATYPVDWISPVYWKSTSPDGPEDLTASFRVAYDLKANLLYLAITVQDDDLVVGNYWPQNRGDMGGVYIDVDHSGRYRSGPLLKSYMAKFIGEEVVSSRLEQTTIYEWATPLFESYSEKRFQIEPGKIIGFDVVVADADGLERANNALWTPTSSKSATSARYGDLVFVQDYGSLGFVTGRAVTAKARKPYSELVIQAYKGDQAVESGRTDSSGQYSLKLLPGEYALKPRRGQGVEPFEVKSVAVHAREETAIDIVVTPIPLLANLSFWVPPERLSEFEAAYEEQLAPILKKQGWVRSHQRVRVRIDSVFTRLFEVKNILDIDVKFETLWESKNSAMKEVLWDFGRAFGSSRSDSLIRGNFSLYSAPVSGRVIQAGDGRTVESGIGKKVMAGDGIKIIAGDGLWERDWQSLISSDGLISSSIEDMQQDRAGNIWFAGVLRGGISRYDGQYFTNFTTDNGLASNEVAAIEEDRKGMLWFGTWGGGICRYDGTHFTTFTTEDGLAGNWVQSILEDRQGNVWFGTGRGFERDHDGAGVSRFDGESFTTFTVEDGLVGNTVSCIVEDPSGRLWFGTEGGVSRYDSERHEFTTFTPEDGLMSGAVMAGTVDQEGNVWFVHKQGGVSRFDGQRISTLTDRDGLPGYGYDNWVMSILEDSGGNMWFGTWGSGVSRYDGERMVMFTSDDGLAHNKVRSILEDREGNLWFATEGGGVSRYDEGAFTHFTEKEGLNSEWLWRVWEDTKGNIWVADQMEGMSRYDGKGVTHYTLKDGLGFWTRAILEDGQGDLWFATRQGVSRYDGEQFETFTTEDGLAHFEVWSILEDQNGYLWFGTLGGVSRYDGEQFETFTTEDGLAHNEVFSILEDQNGYLWFCTHGGLSRYDGEKFTTFDVENGLASNDVHAIFQDRKDNLWIGTDGGGVSRYDGQQFTTFTEENGLSGNSVWSIIEDQKGNLWFHTSELGMSRYDGQQFTTFTEVNGLRNSNVTSMMVDQRGHLWFGSLGDGVSRYDGLVFQNLLKRDGLVSNAVVDILEDRNGDIWIATEGGLTQYRPYYSPPPVFITDVVTSRRHGPVKIIRLPTSQGYIAFNFYGRSFKTRPNRIVYVYRLNGYDTEWRQTRQQQVEYTDLPAGDYVFEVKAVDRDLNYSEEPARVAVEVYYQPLSSSVRLAEIQVQDLFASFYQAYAQRPVGSVRVDNLDPNPMQATLRFSLPGLMRRPFEQPLELPANSSQYVEFRPILDPAILELEEPTPVQAEVALSFAAGEQTISIEETKELTVYGRGALRWDDVARAAAFITPTDPHIEAFARPTLAAFNAEIQALGKPGHNLVQALVLFEALKRHGVRYIADANNPYAQRVADQAAVDDIQYPAEVLHNKAGDCDDLTALFCALLENAGISTALVDYPEHIFLLFDTGIKRQQAYRLPVDESLYIERGDRLWIPLEITLLDQTFHQAWRKGAEELLKRSASDRRSRVVDTEGAWVQFSPASPSFEGKVVAPERVAFEATLLAQYDELKDRIDAYIETTYIDRLESTPANDTLRLELIQLYCALLQYDQAINTATRYLVDEVGDEAATLNQLGIARFLKGEVTQAVLHFRDALKLRPEDKELQGNLALALEKLGKTEDPARKRVTGTAGTGQAKSAAEEVDVDDFYWLK